MISLAYCLYSSSSSITEETSLLFKSGDLYCWYTAWQLIPHLRWSSDHTSFLWTFDLVRMNMERRFRFFRSTELHSVLYTYRLHLLFVRRRTIRGSSRILVIAAIKYFYYLVVLLAPKDLWSWVLFVNKAFYGCTQANRKHFATACDLIIKAYSVIICAKCSALCDTICYSRTYPSDYLPNRYVFEYSFPVTIQ